ncbi:MAG TPA: nuclear transport factor 2 family protein [Terracidiphilus sp.]|nr:nuclear transport factor 2 family protein [Terracidiphilus sp.]
MGKLLVLILSVGLAPVLRAQEPVVAASDIDALFRSPDPKLQANKMVVYGIYRDLLQAGHWELAGRYLTERYIQHNPNAASGRDGVVKFFTEVLKVKPTPIPARLTSPIVAVLAEGDMVTVLSVADRKDSAGKAYTTTWFDTWRIKEGKADEHWDCATKQ